MRPRHAADNLQGLEMGSLSIVHLLIAAAVVILLFGAGRLSNVMGEFAKGIKAFRAGLKEDEPPTLTQQTPPPASPDRTGSEHKVG
jgi:sec-independent protein translocase protein TatA